MVVRAMRFAKVVAPVPPWSTATVVPCQTPVAIVPTDVRLDAVTPDASADPVRLPAAAAGAAAHDGLPDATVNT